MIGRVDVQHARLEGMLRACPGLTNLNIFQCDFHVSEVLRIGTLCPKLESLSIDSDIEYDANTMVRDISTHCSQLRVLAVPGNWELTTAALVEVATRCPLLQEVDIRGCMEVRDGFLDALAQHCGGMKVLYLDGCVQMTDAGVRAVMQGCAGLQELTVRDCTRLSDELKEEIGRRYPVKLIG
jgi:hypothetical protein